MAENPDRISTDPGDQIGDEFNEDLNLQDRPAFTPPGESKKGKGGLVALAAMAVAVILITLVVIGFLRSGKPAEVAATTDQVTQQQQAFDPAQEEAKRKQEEQARQAEEAAKQQQEAANTVDATEPEIETAPFDKIDAVALFKAASDEDPPELELQCAAQGDYQVKGVDASGNDCATCLALHTVKVRGEGGDYVVKKIKLDKNLKGITIRVRRDDMAPDAWLQASFGASGS